MTPRLACSDVAFPLLSPDKVLDLIVLLDLPAVDLGLFEGRSQLQPSAMFRDTARSAAAYRRQLADRGLELADVFLQMDPDFAAIAVNHPRPERRRKARDWFQHTLDFAEACDCGHVTALPGVHFPEEPEGDSLSRAVDELAWRCRQAEARGIVFSVEPHVGSLVSQPRQVLDLLEKTPGLTLTLDYTHFVKQGTAEAEIEPLVRHASHFHVRGGRQGRLQASFAENTIDYGRVLETMRQTDYRGYLVLEYVWIDWEHCNEVDNLSETIQWRRFFLGNTTAAASESPVATDGTGLDGG